MSFCTPFWDSEADVPRYDAARMCGSCNVIFFVLLSWWIQWTPKCLCLLSGSCSDGIAGAIHLGFFYEAPPLNTCVDSHNGIDAGKFFFLHSCDSPLGVCCVTPPMFVASHPATYIQVASMFVLGAARRVGPMVFSLGFLDWLPGDAVC